MDFESEMKRLTDLEIQHGGYRARELTANEIALLKKELEAERASARSLAALNEALRIEIDRLNRDNERRDAVGGGGRAHHLSRAMTGEDRAAQEDQEAED
jgi:hypothetical protein